jgi:hypothetical protein
MHETHLPDPAPPIPQRRHPMLATGTILGVVIGVCLLLAFVSML